ncbi:MAG: sugar ABC transporter permease [Oscillospiraceae bacterium]|nr:sugar ABC transporter permease [Oscillospiraceae bacterium]
MSSESVKKRKKSRLEKTYWGYIFIIPFFVTYIIFSAFPLVTTFYYAFTNKSTFGDVGEDGTEHYDYVGLTNFYENRVVSARATISDDRPGEVRIQGTWYKIYEDVTGAKFIEMPGDVTYELAEFNGTDFVCFSGKIWELEDEHKEGIEAGTLRAVGHQASGVLGNETYKRAFLNTPLLWAMGFVPQMIIALLLAALFTNEKLKVKGRGFFKVAFYMPNIMTAATIGAMFLVFINSGGLIHQLAVAIGYIGENDILREAWFARAMIAFINSWMWFGNSMIVLIAGISAINPSLYEAGTIDGASGRTMFWKITIPLIRPILTFTVVQSLIGGFQMYDIPKVLAADIASSLDRTGTTTIMTTIMAVAFESPSKALGLASAMSVTLFGITTVCSIIIFGLFKDRSEEKWIKNQKKQQKLLQQQESGVAKA